jgi:GT2 family glycosyltransferase
VFHAVGTFDELLRGADDWDWYMRAREVGIPILVQNDVVLFYRRHDENLTNQREENDRATVQILRRSLERRRKRHGSASSLPPVRGSTSEDADP